MLNFSLSTTLSRNTVTIKLCGKRSAAFNPNYRGKHLIIKFLIPLISFQILISFLCFQGINAQEITDQEISILQNQLDITEKELASIDQELKSLNERFETVRREKDRLQQDLSASGGFFSGLTNIFKRRRLENLYTELQDLSDRINELNKRREPLVGRYVALADELIDKSNLRMKALMESILKDETEDRQAAKKLVSNLWQSAERVREIRNKYAPTPLTSEQATTFPPLLSSDPEELRLGIAILKDEAEEARAEVAELKEKVEEQRRRKGLLDLRLEIRRSDEERGSVGPEDDTAPLPWGSSDEAIRRDIEGIEKEIDRLLDRIQKSEEKARRFESQIQRFEAELNGKPGND
jgi:hypothetical protein